MKKTILLSLIVFVAGVFSIMPVAAADDPTAASSGRNITITPPTMELFGNPGDVIQDKIKVINNAEVTTTFGIIVEDFTAVGEDGGVGFEKDATNNTFSLASWVTPDVTSFSLDPGKEREVNFTIKVPKDAEPGGHYASILARIGGDAKVSSGASVVSRVGSLILLRVSGNVQEKASIESFSASKFFYKGLPVDFELRVKNGGNNHIKPRGTILITNTFGQKTTELSLNGLNVLPGAIRKMDGAWNEKKMGIGLYTATLVATYGQQNQPLSATVRFFVCPQWLLITLIVLLVLILLMIIGRKQIKKMIHNLTK